MHADDHQDSGLDLFLSRLEWDLTGFDLPIEDFDKQFKPVADRFLMKYRLALAAYRPKMAILVSSYDHCLADLLYRQHTGELACDVRLIISNHTNGQRLSEFFCCCALVAQLLSLAYPGPNPLVAPQFCPQECLTSLSKRDTGRMKTHSRA